MASDKRIAIIGIGDDGLDGLANAARQRVMQAEVLLGAPRVFELLPASLTAQRLELTGDLEQLTVAVARVGEKSAALLVFGDPMFYGLARYVTENVGKERFEVLPHVSSMQLAFARVMESWDDAYLTSLANHSLDLVVERIRTADKVGLFTTDAIGPDLVARALLDRRITYFSAYVCENLGSKNERVTRGTLGEIASQRFEPLNVMILVRESDAPDRPREAIGRRLFGNPDEVFLQAQPKQGLLTPAEVRALALAQLDIAAGSVVWDVGAGSGSVSVEAAQLAHRGAVYAIEMDPEDHELIQANSQRFGVANVIPVLGKAPEIWSNLPDPDAIFVAGSGREVVRLAEAAYGRLRPLGRLVVSLVSIESVSELRQALLALNPDVRVWMLNIARGTDQLERLTFDALKPTFLLGIAKPA